MLPTINQMVSACTMAGTLIEERKYSGFQTNFKPDESLVTSADLHANEYLRCWSTDFSVDFIGEEGNSDTAEQEHIIYVDPLDGTSTFVAGKAEVSVVMTLMQKAGHHWIPIAAVIHEPSTGRSWWAEADYGTFFQPKVGGAYYKLPRLGSHPKLAHVSVITWRNVPFHLGMVRNALEIHSGMCHHGSGNTSINGGLIASGSMHGCIFGGTSAVETTAMHLIVTQAGGIATDLWGTPLVGYELQADSSGKRDFALPHGAIMTCDQALNDQLSQLVQVAQ